MAFPKYAKAAVVRPHIGRAEWSTIRTASRAAVAKQGLHENLVTRAASLFGKPFDPNNYLMTHATIIASVDTYDPGQPTGSFLQDGFRGNRKFPDFRVQPECDKYINNNLDCWSRGTLLKAYPTFVGGHNFVEHVQIEELSKGRIIDAVARDIGDSIYVDILIATDRKHTDLIKAIEEHKISTLSMGCFLPGTQVSLADGRRIAIEDVQPGDMVLTHKGRAREVLNKQIRGGVWGIRRIQAVGIPTTITATDNHPFYVFRQPDVCACGCGGALSEYKNGRKNATRTLARRFLRGHDKRVFNPNNIYSLEEARERKTRLESLQAETGQWVRADELRVGDFLCFPRVQEASGAGVSNGRARLLGYFLAEGSFLKREGVPCETQFCFSLSEKDTFVAEVVALLKQEFPGNEPWVQDRPDQNTCTVHIAGEDTAMWFKAHGGEYSNHKRLSSEAMGWTVENHRHLVGAWLNGDGSHGRQYSNQSTVGTTTSYDLACQMHLLMARCGWFARMECKVGAQVVDLQEVVNGGFVRDTICGRLPSFNLVVGKVAAQEMAPYTVKVAADPGFRTQGPRVRDDMILFPVTSVVADTYEGYVHNMEVEEDHSYLVSGVCAKNCTVDGTICTKCGHWAADETELCFPTGTRVLMADGKYLPIEDVVEGDLVVTHTGAIRPVRHTMSRQYDGHVTVLDVDGIPNPVRATTGHRFWVLRPETVCQCGCGEALRRTVEHERGAVQAFQRRFLPGHNSRVWLHNRETNLVLLSDYKQVFEPRMEFVPAKEIRRGDYLTFPIPQEVRQSPDATEARARLIGYFLAEGSFIKRNGERVGVSFDFGAHEYDTLAAEVEALLNAEWGRDERRTTDLDWQNEVSARGITPVRRRKTSRPLPEGLTCPSCRAPSDYIYNVRFKKGRNDCYACKVCKRQWVEGADRAVKAHRLITGKSACTVRLMWADAAAWFYHYCGEYAHEKALPAEVMFWPPEVQKHILFGWLGGDGTQSRLGVTGTTTSFALLSQMHVLAARCGWYSRKQVVFNRKTAILDEVVNGSSIVRDESGWLPSFLLTLAEPAGFGGEVRFSDPEHARVTMSALTDGFKRVGNYLLYRVRDVRNECFSGRVHNIEVAEDESYVVEGLAVHNCPHVKYEKGNRFFDEQGRMHRVAELCGHESLDPTGGVQFIEASWVGVPAFTGAVLRNIIVPGADLAKKAQQILESPPPQWAAESRVMAASTSAVAPNGGLVVARVTPPKLGVRVGEVGDPHFVVEDSKEDDMFLAGWDDDIGGDSDPAEGGEAPASSAPQTPEDPLKALEDDLVRAVKERVQKRLREELAPPSVRPSDSSIKTNSNIVKDAYIAGLDAIVRTASTDANLLDAVAKFNRINGIHIPVSLYRAALKVGSTARYRSVEAFLESCAAALGRQPAKKEALTLLRLGKLLARGGSVGGSSKNGSRQGGPT